MKSLFLILLFIVVSMDISASTWKKFDYARKKPVATAYQMKKGIVYIEIRLYEVDRNYKKVIKKGYKVIWKAYHDSLSSFDHSVVNKFKSISPNLSSESDISKYSSGHNIQGSDRHYFIGNAFYIDEQNRIGHMNTKKDIFSFLLPIDNVADLSFFLWLNEEYYVKNYRTASKGYEVRVDEHDEFNSDERKCGIYTYRMYVGKNGKLGKKYLDHFKYTGCSQP